MTTTPTLSAARAELLRALGVVALDPPSTSVRVLDALGLSEITGAEHTEAFVLLAPPHAAIHLGDEGKLGGEALDRVEGFWRALGTTPPRDADHLGVLLLAYAGLREMSDDAADHAARALFHEHLWSWAPGYLDGLRSSCAPAVAQWCELTLDALRAEALDAGASDDVPLALRDAPEPLREKPDKDELLDAMVTPIRSGVVLSQRDVAAGADHIGVGFRRGERRFALKAMLEQDAHATLSWFAAQADTAARRHTESYGLDATGRWWRARAFATAEVVADLAKGTR